MRRLILVPEAVMTCVCVRYAVIDSSCIRRSSRSCVAGSLMSASIPVRVFMIFGCSIRRLGCYIVENSLWLTRCILWLLLSELRCNQRPSDYSLEGSLVDHVFHCGGGTSLAPCMIMLLVGAHILGIDDIFLFDLVSLTLPIYRYLYRSPLVTLHSAASAVSDQTPSDAETPRSLSLCLSQATSSMLKF